MCPTAPRPPDATQPSDPVTATRHSLSSSPSRLRSALAPLRAALYDFDPKDARAALKALIAPEAELRWSHPFGEGRGPDVYWERLLAPLAAALPDLERRDGIVIAGRTDHGDDWVGCGGCYHGTFEHAWLDIPPTGHAVALRFHEFYRMEEGRAVEVQAIWDVPEVMLQAGAWPMAPGLGREWQVPWPATQDGLADRADDPHAAEASRAHVVAMLQAMKRHPSEGGPETMEMERFWHPRFGWYGPAGIGTGRGIRGFRNWHQIPFLAAMPDRGGRAAEITYHFIGDGPYVGVTGWPNMLQTLTHAGWLGLPGTGQKLEMRSLDFWRLEAGLIRENWVLVDLLHMYDQLGLDVLGRMREFNKARLGFDRDTGRAL